jgi:hypothetical protein
MSGTRVPRDVDISRRRLLGAAGAGALVGLAGCTGLLDRGRSAAGVAGRPDGTLSSALADAVYAPGGPTDARHQLLATRDFDALRDHRGDSVVADALLERPLAKAEQGFDLDPGTVADYAVYGPTEVFAGSFGRQELVESYRADDWEHAGTHRGLDVFVHPEHGDYYAGGVGDGVLFTAARDRGAPAAAYVRGHAEALAGATARYRDDARMGALLSVVGGGDHVTAITSDPDLGERPPNTRAVGRSVVVEGSDLETTFAFYIDEDAARSPKAVAEEWANRYRSSDVGAALSTTAGAEGRVGYFSTTVPAGDLEGDTPLAALRDRDPTRAMERLVGRRYTERNGLEPPGVTFTYRTLPDVPVAEADCGVEEADFVVELTHDAGPAVPARQLVLAAAFGDGMARVRPLLRLRGCGYGVTDELASGDSFRVALPTIEDAEPAVLWSGPHGNTGRLETVPEGG